MLFGTREFSFKTDFWISDQYIGNFIRYDMVRSMVSFLKKALENCNENPKLGALPLSVRIELSNFCYYIYF